jgi:hypothetical protein
MCRLVQEAAWPDAVVFASVDDWITYLKLSPKVGMETVEKRKKLVYAGFGEERGRGGGGGGEEDRRKRTR